MPRRKTQQPEPLARFVLDDIEHILAPHLMDVWAGSYKGPCLRSRIPANGGGNLMLLVSTAQLITGKSLFHTGGGIAIKL